MGVPRPEGTGVPEGEGMPRISWMAAAFWEEARDLEARNLARWLYKEEKK
jgi:hypothetical protein